MNSVLLGRVHREGAFALKRQQRHSARIVNTLFMIVAVMTVMAVGVSLTAGQGGTGRENAASKKTPPKKKTSGPKRPGANSGTNPQSTNANSSTAASATPLESVKTPSGIDLVRILPGGTFMMGSENGEASEKPVHRVTFLVNEEASARGRLETPNAETDFQSARRDLIRVKSLRESNFVPQSDQDAAQARYNTAKAKLDSLRTETGPYGFYIGKYEVTQAQWHAVMGNNPSYFKSCPNCPVEQVSWNDVQEFLDKLNDRNDGFRYRLPTEAEWEYACRAATDVTNNAANVNRVAWYDQNSAGKTHPVGQRTPNQFQLHDMQGNVWEWCLDWYHESYDGAPTDGSAWFGEQAVASFSGHGARVLRGGSMQADVFDLRSASRYRYAPDYRYMSFGFRVVAIPQSK